MGSIAQHFSRYRAGFMASGLAFSSIASANCGMDACPIAVQTAEGKPASSLLTDFRFTTVGYDHYTETTLGGRINLGRRMALGARVPFIALSQAGESSNGLGNIVGFGTWSVPKFVGQSAMDLGLQLEVPTVSSEELGDAHFLLLPTVRVGWSESSWALSVTSGYSRVLDMGHSEHDGHHHHHAHGDGHEAPKSIVNPHAASEVLLRVDVGTQWSIPTGTLHTGMRVDGVQSLDAGTETGPFAAAGPVIQLTTGTAVSEVAALLPVTRHTHYSHRAVARIHWVIPQ